MIVDYYSKIFSPFFTRLFLHLKSTPNQVTLSMIVSGLIGSILFAFQSHLIQYCGVLFIHLWYILDGSDGEVARITKRFSLFGSEIDYTAHVINHPFFTLTFATNLLFLNRYDTRFVLLTAFILISEELILRNIYTFFLIYSAKVVQEKTNIDIENQDNLTAKMIGKAILRNLMAFPNFALIFPIFYLIDLQFETSLAFAYFLSQTFFTFILSSIMSIKWLRAIIDR